MGRQGCGIGDRYLLLSLIGVESTDVVYDGFNDEGAPGEDRLGPQVRFELDGGDRTKVRRVKAKAKAGAITVCLPVGAASMTAR